MSIPIPPTAGRRRNMQAIRRRDTTPELALRSILHASGYRYRCDFRLVLPGGTVRPDVVFTRRHVAIFVDGCFWHSCPEHGSKPSVNQSYWAPKLQRNAERDARNNAILTEAGWHVVRVWEHENAEEAAKRIASTLELAP